MLIMNLACDPIVWHWPHAVGEHGDGVEVV
jgi:hypothetical protein